MKLYTYAVCVSVLAFAAGHSNAQMPAPERPQELILGRETFFDFGPPFQYFDIYIVKRENNESTVRRISLTPEANKCYAPAKVEFVEKTSALSMKEILLDKDPCRIPERKIRKESKKQRKGMTFSGANIALQIKCGTQMRTLRVGVGDKDWFDKEPGTPENTSWAMQLLEKLDRIAGPTAMDKPMFAVSDPPADPPASQNPAVFQDLSSGKYDELFPGSTMKASEIYKASLIKSPEPTVQLTDSSPVKPLIFTLPKYPRLPLLAAHEGWARVHLIVDPEGSVSSILLYEGSKLFEGVVRDAILSWKFPADSTSREVTVSLDFKLNCKTETK